ncbi:FAD-dependent oxidoreductase [Streptomyces anthocyanicus]|uniref:FAD-dependent oxidoreductase n=1 Tax=Streptomyces anthocyanicus TaxID=68174 RepID=UPI00386B24CF
MDELGVATQESEMSMSVRCEGCGLEYAGARDPAGLLARPRNALHGPLPAQARPGAPVPPRRPRAAHEDADQALTLGGFLDREGFSPYFRAHFMTPVVSAVRSCDAATALRHPAAHLFRFLHHHGMLAVGGSPVWRTVTGGSRARVDRIAERLPDVRTATPVRTVTRHADGVDATAADGTRSPATRAPRPPRCPSSPRW